MRDHRSPAQVIREWRLPRAEREAAAAERRAEHELRRERDNEETAARRAAALEAEARRGYRSYVGRLHPTGVTIALAMNVEDDPTPLLLPAVKALLATHR